jgi:hypothetical protein
MNWKTYKANAIREIFQDISKLDIEAQRDLPEMTDYSIKKELILIQNRIGLLVEKFNTEALKREDQKQKSLIE